PTAIALTDSKPVLHVEGAERHEAATDPGDRETSSSALSSVDLYWLPLGAGGHSVRLNGIVYEALVARLKRRRACDLYHSALKVRVPSGQFVIEMTPVRAGQE